MRTSFLRALLISAVALNCAESMADMSAAAIPESDYHSPTLCDATKVAASDPRLSKLPAFDRALISQIASVDLDHDGRLSEAEAAHLNSIGAGDFKLIDTDGDGFISLSEMKVWYMKGIQEYRDSLMNDLDANHDRYLDASEIPSSLKTSLEATGLPYNHLSRDTLLSVLTAIVANQIATSVPPKTGVGPNP